MSKPLPHLLLLVITLILCGQAHGRYKVLDGRLDLVSDGVHRFGTSSSSSSYLTLNRPRALARDSRPRGHRRLFLPILGALPDAMLILVSGLSGSTETAQSQVSVGMGLLAGSTVMLITVVWASCVIIGKCDIEDNVAINKKDTKGFSLTGSGVSTDQLTRYSAIIMAVSVIPFIVVQLPQLLSSTSARRWAVLIALILSLALLISYCMYQIYQPWIQFRRLAYAKHKHVISGLLQHLKNRALGKLLADDGEPDENVIKG
ncbi:hypothetical protein M0R45_014678 [Rubus argutus]|uniref:Sodium/calcium exchanger membrane region domain-containing protein n=1 Tax=Rubus argutus TaxID=59490 RepID=A0AAW1XM45_RUBAR